MPPSSATRPSARPQQASAHHASRHGPAVHPQQFGAYAPAYSASAAFVDNGDALNMSEIRLRLLQEEADRIALEEQVFLLERSNRALSIETQTLRIHLHDMQQRAQSAEERAARRLPKAAAAGVDQQLTAALMELHRVSAERDDAHRRLAAMAKADDQDFLSTYLQLEDDHQRVVAEKGRLQDRVRELTEVESQLVEHKLHAAQMHEKHDDLEFHVRHTIEPHIAMLERDLDQREQTIHYLHQMLADERAKNGSAPK